MLGWRGAPFASLFLAAALCAAAAALAQSARANPIPGYLDPKTNSFTPLPPSATSVAPATAGVTIKGTIVVDVVAKIDPSVPADAVISVQVGMQVTDPTRSASVSTNSPTLNRHGNSGRVTVKLPYFMSVGSTSDPMTITVSCVVQGGGSCTGNLAQTISIPANGTTTTVNFPVLVM